MSNLHPHTNAPLILYGDRDAEEGERVTAVWSKLHNYELYNYYSSHKIISVIKIEEDEMGRTCSRHVGDGKCIQNFSWKTSRKETS